MTVILFFFSFTSIKEMVLLKRALAHKPNDLKKATFTLA